jgi:hypothetical protein
MHGMFSLVCLLEPAFEICIYNCFSEHLYLNDLIIGFCLSDDCLIILGVATAS